MTKSQKNAIFKAKTVLFQVKWDPYLSDTAKVEVKKLKIFPGEQLSVNNDSLPK